MPGHVQRSRFRDFNFELGRRGREEKRRRNVRVVFGRLTDGHQLRSVQRRRKSIRTFYARRYAR